MEKLDKFLIYFSKHDNHEPFVVICLMKLVE